MCVTLCACEQSAVSSQLSVERTGWILHVRASEGEDGGRGGGGRTTSKKKHVSDRGPCGHMLCTTSL